MTSSRRIKLNVSVEPQLETDFKSLCEYENVSFASALQDYMRWSIDRGTLIDRCTLSNSNSYPTQLTNYFAEREIETLKMLATKYSEILNDYNLLQKRVLQLEKLLQKA